MLRTVILLIVALVTMASGCETTKNGQKDRPSEEPEIPKWENDARNLVWIATDPIQCMNNPWEKDWLENNDADRTMYPKGEPRQVEAPEKKIITAFFEEKGVKIHALDSEPYPDDQVVCEACTCPEGYTLYLQVESSAIPVMKEYNFDEVTR